MSSEASRKMAEEWLLEESDLGHYPHKVSSLAALLDKRAEAEKERIKWIVIDEVGGSGASMVLRGRILSRIEET